MKEVGENAREAAMRAAPGQQAGRPCRTEQANLCGWYQ